MTGLFDLPSEIFFQIIHLVVSLPLPIPPNGKRYRPAWQPSGRQTSCFPSPRRMEAPNALSLLLTSRRVCAETNLYISKKPRVFSVDIAIVNDHWIWPTWRTVPVPTTHGVLDKIEISLTLCCTEDERHLQTNWSRLSTSAVELEFFLRYFVTEKPLVTRINTLIVNIDTTRYDNGNQVISEEVVPLRRIDGLAHLDFSLLYPVDAQNSCGYLSQLFSVAKSRVWAWRPSPDHEEFCKPIRNMLFCIDGNVSEELKIADHVAS